MVSLPFFGTVRISIAINQHFYESVAASRRYEMRYSYLGGVDFLNFGLNFTIRNKDHLNTIQIAFTALIGNKSFVE